MTETKTPLLLHICCAPDEAWVVRTLKDDYNLYCFFCNPNIQPTVEYELRLAQARAVAKRFETPFEADAYDPGMWEAAIQGLDNTPEGGDRCMACFRLRLDRAARFCREINWRDFTTVMSISPHKKIAMLNQAGDEAAEKYGLQYRHFDFKKKNGFVGSIQLSKQLGLYRQDYCGCRLSKAERDRRKQAQTDEKQAITGAEA